MDYHLGSHRHNWSQLRFGCIPTAANLIGWCGHVSQHIYMLYSDWRTTLRATASDPMYSHVLASTPRRQPWMILYHAQTQGLFMCKIECRQHNVNTSQTNKLYQSVSFFDDLVSQLSIFAVVFWDTFSVCRVPFGWLYLSYLVFGPPCSIIYASCEGYIQYIFTCSTSGLDVECPI